MPTGYITSSISVGGIEFSSNISRTEAGNISHSVAVAAGVAGLKSATGVDTLPTGHGFVASDIVDVHWTDPGDGSHKVRRGFTVDTATANAITYDETPAAEGDTLPANGTAVVVSKRVTIDSDWDGDLVHMLAQKSTQKAVADFRTSSASLSVHKLAAEQAFSWVKDMGIANPFAGTPVDKIIVSNGSTTAATYQIGILYDSA